VLVALDESFDGSRAGVAALHGRETWYREFDTFAEALKQALDWNPDDMVVGLSLQPLALKLGVQADAYSIRETSNSTPLLLETVKRRALAHEHSEMMSMEAEGAIVVTTDTGGLRLSVKGSSGSILGLKLTGWCLLRDRDAANDAPAIYI
jgi:hypothetical protein